MALTDGFETVSCYLKRSEKTSWMTSSMRYRSGADRKLNLLTLIYAQTCSTSTVPLAQSKRIKRTQRLQVFTADTILFNQLH